MKKLNVIVVSVGITIFGVVAMLTGNDALAGNALIALAGWLGGNKNGSTEKKPTE